jgi:L,D-transpeptidase-like protein
MREEEEQGQEGGSGLHRVAVPHRLRLIAGAVGSLLVTAVLVSPAASTAEPVTTAGPEPADPVVLSNERTLTRWAYVTSRANVHARPDSGSEVLSELGTRTHDRTRELVLALAQVTHGDQTWVQVRFKSRPNGQIGWVDSDSLGAFQTVTTFLEINRKKLRATLFKGGERVWSAPVGIGQARTLTPAGNFYVRERLIPRDTRGVYGVFAFGTSATSPTLTDWPGGGIIGIHGTNEPGLIPGRISHGCVRVRNKAITRLRRLMVLGTPIQIL